MRCRQGEGEGEEVREGLTQPFSKPKLRKGLWSPEEDEKLIAYIINNRMLGCSWASVAKQAGLQRCGKSCRLRWINYLRPGLKRGAFSRHEERLIMNLQSIMGNRWSQIAAHMPGRTDNEIKNYWNSAIKKKLKLKHHLSSSTTNCNTDAKSNIPDRSHRISHTNSAFSHAYDAPASLRSAQPYSNAMPEGYQTPKNTFNVLTNGENQLCVPGVLELKQEQVQDQNDEINQLISYFEILNDTTTHTNDSVSSHADFISPSQQAKVLTESCKTTIPPLEGPDSANYSLGSTGITIPAVTERDCLEKQYENDRWRTSHCCSNANDGFHVADPEAYTVHKAEDYKSLYEKTTHQASPPLSFRSQFAGPAIKCPPGQSNEFQSNEFQSENDCRDDLNLKNDVNLGIPKYVDIYCRKNNYQLPHIDGGVGNQWNFSTIPHEETDANPIPTILAGGGSRLFQIECEAGAGQVTGWAHDGIYNLNTSAISDFDQIYFS